MSTVTTAGTPAPSRPAAPTPPTTAQAAWLVAGREIRARLRSKSFLISTGILLVLVLGGLIVGNLLSATAGSTTVAVVGDAGTSLQGLSGIDTVDAADRDAADELVESGKADAAVVPDADSPTGFTIVADAEAPDGLVQQLSVVPQVELLNPSDTNAGLRYLVALGFGLVFFMAATTFGSTIAQSVVEEKQTRIIEILVAAVPARALLAGKVIGTSILAFGQIAVLIAAAVIGLTITGQTEVLSLIGGPIVWFAVFFVFGFVLLAALFAATGAMVSRLEDIASTTTPVTMLVMIPYFLVIFANDNPLIVAIMSYVPFSAPVGMPLRLFLGDAQWWEPLVSLALLVGTTAVVLALGARIYENSLLKLGSRVPWREALRS